MLNLLACRHPRITRPHSNHVRCLDCGMRQRLEGWARVGEWFADKPTHVPQPRQEQVVFLPVRESAWR